MKINQEFLYLKLLCFGNRIKFFTMLVYFKAFMMTLLVMYILGFSWEKSFSDFNITKTSGFNKGFPRKCAYVNISRGNCPKWHTLRKKMLLFTQMLSQDLYFLQTNFKNYTKCNGAFKNVTNKVTIS